MSSAVVANSLWVAISAILVLLMNFGLAFFYSGLVSGRNALNTIKMSIITLGVIPVLWWAIGYSLIFSGTGKFIGSVDFAFFNNIGINSIAPDTQVLSIAFICFQTMFASIAPAIISGSGVERLKFRTYVLFIILWAILVYCPLAHSVWNPNGWAYLFGAFDFAGGIVVHVSAGFSGLALALVLRPRSAQDEKNSKHNLPMMVMGAGLLWFGWFGFNGGSALSISDVSIHAFATTLFATSGAILMWLICDFILQNPHSLSGFCSSLIIGLVAITPSAGYVSVSSSIGIGVIASFLSYVLSIYYNKKIKHAVDDTLDVFICHGIPGFLGGIMVGVFASHNVNSSIPSGLIYGNWDLLYKQVVVTFLGAIFSFAVTYIILLALKHTIGIRVRAEDEVDGLDVAEHGEKAYKLK